MMNIASGARQGLALLALSAALPACSSGTPGSTAPPGTISVSVTAVPAAPAAASATSTGEPAAKPAPARSCKSYQLEGCQERCDGGDLVSCYRLAFELKSTRDEAKVAEARALYTKAGDGGHGKSCQHLSLFYSFGEGVAEDKDKAVELEKKALSHNQAACDKGDPDACDLLADAYRLGRHLTKDEAKAKELSAKIAKLHHALCEQGSDESCSAYGVRLSMGDGVVKNAEQAVSYLTKGCDLGDLAGCSWLAGHHEDGTGVAQSRERAVELYQKACTGGFGAACAALKRLSSVLP